MSTQQDTFDVDVEPPDDGTRTVYIVVTNYDGDPHPHVELVTTDEDEADELMDDCAAHVGGPWPIAWRKVEVEIEV